VATDDGDYWMPAFAGMTARNPTKKTGASAGLFLYSRFSIPENSS
jgi:hypothetical protein